MLCFKINLLRTLIILSLFLLLFHILYLRYNLSINIISFTLVDLDKIREKQFLGKNIEKENM